MMLTPKEYARRYSKDAFAKKLNKLRWNEKIIKHLKIQRAPKRAIGDFLYIHHPIIFETIYDAWLQADCNVKRLGFVAIMRKELYGIEEDKSNKPGNTLHDISTYTLTDSVSDIQLDPRD